MKILFTHSYFLRFDPKQWATGQPYAPLGTLYAAAMARQEGYEVSLHDTMFAKNAEDIIPVLEKTKPACLVICDDGFNYLTKMCLTNMREAAFDMIAFAKQKGCTVIVSSSDSTDRYEEYLDKGADYILLGEAEMTLVELLKTIEEKKELLGVKGLAYQEKNALIKTAARPVTRDLDALPFPAWDLVDITPYRDMWMKSKGYFSMNMGTTRGCPFKCNWCAKPIYGNRYNSRSPQNVIEELKLLREKFQFDHIWFCDDIFGLKPGWVQAFADLVQKEALQFSFKIQARADLLTDETYVHALALAGCENAWMGAESGSQRILDAMDKGTTVQQIAQSTLLLKKHGIHPSFFIQFGYLGETREDIRKTIEMIRKLMPHELGISVSYPLPGTAFYDKVKAGMQEKTNWTDSDELALMFRNTYRPAFYKELHRYTHFVFRKQQGLAIMKKALRNPFAITAADYKKILAAVFYFPSLLISKIQMNRYANG